MAGTETFARLRLTGARFDHPGMPVESLVEVAAYRDLVLAVAKAQYFEEHGERRRTPRGFADRLQLRLETVEHGSSMPVLERPVDGGALLAVADEFDIARDTIGKAVEAVAAGGAVPSSFPREVLVQFNRFGRTLRRGENIELRPGNAATGPVYSVDVRRKLVLSAKHTYQEQLKEIGWISKVDSDGMSCHLRVRGGPNRPVPAPLDEVTFGAARDSLEPNGEGPAVLVSGVGVFDGAGTLLRLDSIDDVAVLSAGAELAAIDTRLDELAMLEGGWLDGEGERISGTAITSARRVLAELLTLDISAPRIFPTPDGGVHAEWNNDDVQSSVEFEPSGALYTLALRLSDGLEQEETLTGEQVDVVARLVSGE